MDQFNDSKRNQINVALLGCVSVGKSTLMNSLFVETYSSMKMKRTTMVPQVYFESEQEGMDVDVIKSENDNINKNLIYKSENKIPLKIDDISEVKYLVPRVHNLVHLNKNVFLTVYDVPGVNDQATKDLYFQYIDTNFFKFDIIMYVVDITSAMNTSEEIELLKKIITKCKENKEQFDIHNKLIVIANKCDDMYLNKKKLTLEDELQEMFSQLSNTVKTTCDEIFPELEFQIVPLSSEDSYIYRMYDKDPEHDIEPKYVNKFGCNEYGKSRWNRLKDKDKKRKIKELMEGMDINETLELTGFLQLKKQLNSFLNTYNQRKFITNHLLYSMRQINHFNTIDILGDIQKFYDIFIRFKEINQLFNKSSEKNTIFFENIESYLENYKKIIMEKYIDFEKKIITNNSHITQLEQIKEMFDEMARMFNGDCLKITELHTIVTDTINNFYIKEISTKQGDINSQFSKFYKLCKNKFKITLEIITNLFKNNSIFTKPSKDVIEHIEELSSKNFLNKEEKYILIYNFLKDLYLKLISVSTGNTPKNMVHQEYLMNYAFYTDNFWGNLVQHEGKYNELAWLAKRNMILNFTNNQDTEFRTTQVNDCLIIERYLVKNYPTVLKVKKKLRVCSDNDLEFLNNSDSSSDSESYSGNISEELDNELGLEPIGNRLRIKSKKTKR